MSARVTRQIIEVLASGDDGVGRVTRQYIEILGKVGWEFDVEHMLELEHFINSRCRVTLQQIEVLADAIVGQARLTQQFIEVLADYTPLDVDIGSTLALSSVAEATGTRHISVASSVQLEQTVSEHFSVRNVFPENELALADVAKKVIPVDAASILNLTDEIRRIFNFDSELNLTDTAATARNKLIETFLELEGEVERQMIWYRDGANVLELEQAAHVFIMSAGILCNYRPQVGSGSRTIPTTMPTLTPSTFTLFWPFDSASVTVELPAPEFGNRYAFTANRVIRKSRGGTKRVYRKSSWPSWTTIKVDFSWLSAAQKDALIAFAEEHLGQEIGLEDHEGRTWRGVLTTPDFEITHLRDRSGCDNYATSFEFEGVEDVPA